MTGPLFWMITIMTITLLPIVAVLFLFFLAKWRKNRGLYKSSFKSLWKNKLTIGLVLFFYAFSFGAVSGILVFSQRMMWGVEEVSVENHATHTSWDYDPTTSGIFADPAGVGQAAILDDGTTVGQIDDDDSVSNGLYNLITNTQGPITGYSQTVGDLNLFIETNYLSPNLIGDKDNDIENQQEWNQVYSMYGGQLNFYFTLGVQQFVNDWNLAANEFDIYYSFDMYQVYKPTSSVSNNASYMFMSLNNVDLMNGTNSTLFSETSFHSDGVINDDEEIIANEPLFYWYSDENSNGDDGLERLFKENSTLENTEVDNDVIEVELETLGTLNNPYTIAVNQDWFLANEHKFHDSDSTNYWYLQESDSYKFGIDGIYFEVVATFRLPHILYPIQDWTNYVVDTSSQALILMNSVQYSYLNLLDAEKNFTLYFGYSNVYSEINSAMDYTDLEIQQQVTSNEAQLNDSTLVNVFNMPDEYSYYEYLDSFEAARFYVVIFQIEFYVYLAIILMILFLIIAVVLIIFFIRKRIKENTKQIGILKSLGYKNSTIALSYLVYPLTIILVGGAIAVLFSAFMQWIWLIMIGPLLAINLYSFAFTTLATTLIFVIPLALLSIVSIIVTALTLRKKPVDLLSNKQSYAPNLLVRSTGVLFAKTKSFSTSYKIKGSFKALGKSTLLFTSIIGATILLTFSFSSQKATQNAIEATSQEFTTNAYSEFDSSVGAEFISYEGDPTDELNAEYQSVYTFGLESEILLNNGRVEQSTIDYLLNPNVSQADKYTTVISPVITEVDTYIDSHPIISDSNNSSDGTGSTDDNNYNYDINYYIDTDYLFYFLELSMWATVSDALYFEVGSTISLTRYTHSPDIRPLSEYRSILEFLFSQSMMNYALSPVDFNEKKYSYDESIANQTASTLDVVYYNKPQYITFEDSFYSVNAEDEMVPYFDTTFNYIDANNTSQQSRVMVFENTESITKIFDLSENDNPISNDELDNLNNADNIDNADANKWVIPVIANERTVQALSESSFVIEETIEGYTSFRVNLATVEGIWEPTTVTGGSTNNNVYLQVVGTYSSPGITIFFSTIDKFESDLMSSQAASSTPGGDTRETTQWEGYFYLNDHFATEVATIKYTGTITEDEDVGGEIILEDYYLINDSYTTVANQEPTITDTSFSSSLIPLILTNDLLSRQLEEVYSILNLFFILFALIAMVIAVTLIFVAVKDLIDSSRREVAMLKAFGYSNNKATSLVLTPFVLIIAAAYALAIPITWFVLTLMGSALSSLTGVAIVFPISIPSLLIVGSIIAGITVVIILMGWLMFKRTNPLEIIGQTNE